MPERNLDFDYPVDRKGTKCLKYDFAVKRGMPEDILPLWVADMDFKTSSYVIDALEKVALSGIYGYSESDDDYTDAVKGWMLKRHGWKIESSWIIKTPGIVFGLAMAVKALTEVGDGVLIQQPVYYPFGQVIADNDRRVVNSPLVRDAEGCYHMDFEDLERKIADEKVKLLILCSPHNPVGRVWTREELETLGRICARYQVIVVSDEIHSDFVFEGEHNVFSKAVPELAERSIICTSPSKTFNLAGLQVSNLVIRSASIRQAIRHQIDAAGYSQVTLPGLVACEAAYRYGEEWLDALLAYIKANEVYVREYLAEHLPRIRMGRLEGTYLIWLDFSDYGFNKEELNRHIIEDAKLWLDGGDMFGPEGIGFQRINIACPRATLTQALEQLRQAFGTE